MKKRWAGTADYADAAGPGVSINPYPGVTVVTTAGDVHEFFGMSVENQTFDEGLKMYWPKAVSLADGTLHVTARVYDRSVLDGLPDTDSERSIIAFAPGSWTSVVGDGFTGSPPADPVPASNWWAIFRSTSEPESSKQRYYAPVVAWQPTRHDGLSALTAWISNTTDGSLYRTDSTHFGIANWRHLGFTQERPDGTEDWGM